MGGLFDVNPSKGKMFFVELGRVLMSEEAQRSLCCGIGLGGGPAEGYIKLNVHEAVLRAPRGSRCVNVVTKVSSVTE